MRTLLLALLLLLAPAAARAATCTALPTGGNWSSTTTWNCDVLPATRTPTATDDVVIPSSVTVVIDTDVSVESITVAGTLRFADGTTPFAVVVRDGLLVNSGGSFTMAGTGNVTHTLTVSTTGGLINDGTMSFQSGSRVCNVTLNGGGPHTLGGTNPIALNTLTVALTAIANLVNVTGVITMKSGGLTLTSGTFKLASASSLTLSTNSNYTIPTAGRLWITHPSASVSAGTSGASMLVSGGLTLSSGTLSVGSSTSNRLEILTTGTLTLEGGTINLSGRYKQTGSSTAVITDGLFNVAMAGAAGTASEGTFDVPSSSTLTISGGTIHLQNGAASTKAALSLGGVASFDITGGTFILGSGSGTTGTFDVDVTENLHHLTLDAPAARLLDVLELTGNLALNATALDLNGKALLLKGNWSNAGGSLAGGTTVTFNGTAAQTIAGATAFPTLVVNNAAGVTAQSSVSAAGLTFTAGSLVMATASDVLTTAPPAGLPAPTLTRTVAGDAGWRMLSAPAAGATVADLADDAAVQGVTDANDKNLFTHYTGSGWTAPTALTDPLLPGHGFVWYLFEAAFAGGPVTLDVAATAQPDDPRVPLNGTGQFTLAGNPAGFGLDATLLVGTAAPVPKVGLVWKDGSGSAAAGTSGNSTGSYVLTSALAPAHTVAVWQGFFLENPNGATHVTLPDAARLATDGAFQKGPAAAPPLVQFVLEGQSAAGLRTRDEAAVLLFAPEATAGWDVWDATKLTPLTGTYATLAFEGPEAGRLRAQASFPDALAAPVAVGVAVATAGTDGALTLRWPRVELPEAWGLVLHDHATEARVDLRRDSAYAFTPGAAGKRGADAAAALLRGPQPLAAAASRFTLHVGPGVGLSVSRDPLPGAPHAALEAPYPNPFAHEATVAFTLAAPAPARLVAYDLLGRRVAVLADGPHGPGRHSVAFDAAARGLAPGLYVLRLETPGATHTRPLFYLPR